MANGAFAWQTGMLSNPVIMTAQAVAALSGCTFSRPAVKQGLFTDLPVTHWAAEAVSYLAAQGVISGYTDGSFAPARPVTRAEFAKMLIYALQQQDLVNGSDAAVFRDLPVEHWAHNLVRYATTQGYLNGYPDGLVKPEAQVKGAEVMAILVRAIGQEDLAKQYAGAAWYDGYVYIAQANNLLYPEFSAEEPANRAQCAYALRQMQLVMDN